MGDPCTVRFRNHAGDSDTPSKQVHRDEQGRVTKVTATPSGGSPATVGEWSYENDGSGRIQAYKDLNGVVQTYDYDQNGRLTEIAIDQGPTLRYAYNDKGQLEKVQSGEMQAGFSNYDKGVPGAITWGDESAPVKTFTVTKTLEGRIDRIESNDGLFLLDLDWSQHASGSWLIDRVEKSADGFGEVWVPVYTTEKRLDSITITRSTGEVITESYSVDAKRLMGGLTRTVDGVTVIDTAHTADVVAANIRNLTLNDTANSVVWNSTYDTTFGNLTQLSATDGSAIDLTYDSKRRVDSVTHAVPGGSNLTYNYEYDLDNRLGAPDESKPKSQQAQASVGIPRNEPTPSKAAESLPLAT